MVVAGVKVGLVVAGELGLETVGFNTGVVGVGFSVGIVVMGVVTSICLVIIEMENRGCLSPVCLFTSFSEPVDRAHLNRMKNIITRERQIFKPILASLLFGCSEQQSQVEFLDFLVL